MENSGKTNALASTKVTSPFYEPPPRKTSADIINEAKAAIKDSQMVDNSFASASIKPLQTQRPFTPREKERILFGHKRKSNRPPSSFSLRYLQETDFNTNTIADNADSENNTICTIDKDAQITKKQNAFKTQRSNSLSKIGDGKIFDVGCHKIKLPALDALKVVQKKRIHKNTFSLDNLPEEYEESVEPPVVNRNAFSSPQERTDFNENSPFGRPSQQQNNLSQCLLLGVENLNKLFENKQIVENSETLFVKTGYLNNVTRTENEKSSLDVYKERTMENIIETLSKHHKNVKDEVIVQSLRDLYDCMEQKKFLSTSVDSKTKICILKCLYRFVESPNEQLLLNIARIILALKVTGNNLSGVCKLIFKVSKNDKNDSLFLEGNILDLFVDALGRSSPLDDGEACVYGYGSVKFLTMNSKLLKKILDLGILQLMVLHIKIINNARQEKVHIPEHTEHALFQLTGGLRNLAADESVYDEFISTDTVFQLCTTLELFSSNLDIVSNISRTLSTISMNDNCCDKIGEFAEISKIFVKLFEKYPGNEEIIVRLAYTLGNVLAKLDSSRIRFFHEKNSISSLISLWKIYFERTLKNCSLKFDTEWESTSNTEDVMIKIIRIVANIAINTDIGKSMNEQYGLQLIDEFLKVLISNPFKKNDELILSVLSTLNNLSYYYTAEFDRDIFHIKQVDIMEAISEYVNCQNVDCVIEAIRILGNLSRSKITRSYVIQKNIFSQLIKILDEDNLNLLKTTVGVFVNLMADNKNRVLFKNSGGTGKLIRILNQYGSYDWVLTMLICQVLWNFCIDTVNLYELISDNEMQQLLSILADFLDEEKLFGITDTNEDLEIYSAPDYMIWEEFANVATNLLEKIEHFLDTLEQIESAGNIKTKDSNTNLSFAAW
uniref:Armadillo repeat-containing domain-containing protein n=2 Tax=Photinus pyralis TaxID=7054 RepID=A0A1Y1L9N7_PHOPY